MTVYLDTSSLIKLYVPEAGSDVVRALVADAAIVSTSVVTYAEMRAALARLHRERALTAASFASTKRDFEEQWPTLLALDTTNAVSRAAGGLAERYRLRGFDSVQLASYAEVARHAGPRDTVFSSFDDRLNRAARAVRHQLLRSM